MKYIYISGPLTGQTSAFLLKAFYENIATVCSRNGFEPYLPHLASDPVQHAHLSADHVYSLDRSNVEQAHLVIAYVSTPATGVGQEIEIAHQHGIPVILMYETGQAVSRMVRGSPAVIAEVTGLDRDQLLARLEDTLINLFVINSVS
jgi:2'-deoxynucleoside 5'-phosphate N-hydrolase